MIDDRKLLNDGFVHRKNKPISSKPRGCWYNEEKNERLVPDLNYENQADRHWDYYGPEHPYGARLYTDGTWLSK